MTHSQNEEGWRAAATVLCLCTHRKIEQSETSQKLVCNAYLRTYKLIIDAPARRLNLYSLKPVCPLTHIQVIMDKTPTHALFYSTLY